MTVEGPWGRVHRGRGPFATEGRHDLPPASPASPASIVLTGASGGLGRALVAAYARDGVRMLLAGRNEGRLSAAAEIARQCGAEVDRIATGDTAMLAAAVGRFAERHPPDLVLLAAGTKTGQSAGREDPVRLRQIVEANLTGPMEVVQAALPAMVARGSGRIALISSLAAIAPHPDLLSYSATKAGVSAYGIALRRALRGSGVGVSVVIPGFVDTPMTDRHHGPTPLLVPSDRAAALIRRGLDRGRPVIAFPRTLILASRVWGLLPAALGDRIAKRFRATIVDPEADRSETSALR